MLLHSHGNIDKIFDKNAYNISMYLYNRNVLEYAQIARSGPKSMIRNIEGRSSNYRQCGSP